MNFIVIFQLTNAKDAVWTLTVNKVIVCVNLDLLVMDTNVKVYE